MERTLFKTTDFGLDWILNNRFCPNDFVDKLSSKQDFKVIPFHNSPTLILLTMLDGHINFS